MNNDTMQKKAQRWSSQEHNILVEMTNTQIELEAKDPSSVISWPEHWQKVKQRLREHGYIRTEGACQSYSKRLMETQGNDFKEAEEESDENLVGRDIAVPENINADNPSYNKRPLTQESVSSEEDSGRPLKRHRWTDILCLEAVDNIHVREPNLLKSEYLLIPDET